MKTLIKNIQKMDKRIFLATIIIFAAIILFLFFMAGKTDKKIITGANQVISVAEGIRSYYRNKPDYWGLSTQRVIAEKIIPQAEINNGMLKNALGTNILIGSGLDASIAMPGSKSFNIIYDKLSKKDCIGMASFKFEENKSLGLISMTIYNSKYEETFTWGGEKSLPISEYNADKYCLKDNKLIWSFE